MKTKESSMVNRRNFMKTIGILPIVSGAAIVALCQGCSDSPTSTLSGETVTITLANESSLQSIGGSIRRTFGNNNNGLPVIVIRTAQDKFRAMSSYCPHEGGSISSPSGGKAICSKHGAQFGTSEGNFAQNIGGESTTSAQTFIVNYDQISGTITISL
jgi:nitrite reductase/ring-hydroxylating ferredoxin subunit